MQLPTRGTGKRKRHDKQLVKQTYKDIDRQPNFHNRQLTDYFIAMVRGTEMEDWPWYQKEGATR